MPSNPKEFLMYLTRFDQYMHPVVSCNGLHFMYTTCNILKALMHRLSYRWVRASRKCSMDVLCASTVQQAGCIRKPTVTNWLFWLSLSLCCCGIQYDDDIVIRILIKSIRFVLSDQRVLIGAEEGLYTLNLNEIHENTMELVIRIHASLTSTL